MLWLLMIAFDTLLIKSMQTAQLSFNGPILPKSLQFYFFSDVVERAETRQKKRDP